MIPRLTENLNYIYNDYHQLVYKVLAALIEIQVLFSILMIVFVIIDQLLNKNLDQPRFFMMVEF